MIAVTVLVDVITQLHWVQLLILLLLGTHCLAILSGAVVRSLRIWWYAYNISLTLLLHIRIWRVLLHTCIQSSLASKSRHRILALLILTLIRTESSGRSDLHDFSILL